MSAWVKVSDKLPDTEVPVLALYAGYKGKPKIVRALYARKFTLKTYELGGFINPEYDEETDEYYCPEGWYEWNEHDEVLWAIDYPVTHWMSLPELPMEF